MKLNELKQAILTNSLPNDFIILKCNENHFIANQYVEAICKTNNYTLNKITSIYEPNQSALSLVFDYSENINVLSTDIFSECSTDYSIFKNIIVICDKIDKKIAAEVSNYVIDIPDLTDWQLLDYITTYCPGITTDNAQTLYALTKGDIYKITNELDKIKVLGNPNEALSELIKASGTDLFLSVDSLSLYKALTDDIINLPVINNYFYHIKDNAIEPLPFIKSLITKYKKILYIKYKSGLSPAEIESSPAQIAFIQNHYKAFSMLKLKTILTLLTDIDYKLKSGTLNMTDAELMSYIICNILSTIQLN